MYGSNHSYLLTGDCLDFLLSAEALSRLTFTYEGGYIHEDYGNYVDGRPSKWPPHALIVVEAPNRGWKRYVFATEEMLENAVRHIETVEVQPGPGGVVNTLAARKFESIRPQALAIFQGFQSELAGFAADPHGDATHAGENYPSCQHSIRDAKDAAALRFGKIVTPENLEDTFSIQSSYGAQYTYIGAARFADGNDYAVVSVYPLMQWSYSPRPILFLSKQALDEIIPLLKEKIPAGFEPDETDANNIASLAQRRMQRELPGLSSEEAASYLRFNDEALRPNREDGSAPINRVYSVPKKGAGEYIHYSHLVALLEVFGEYLQAFKEAPPYERDADREAELGHVYGAVFAAAQEKIEAAPAPKSPDDGP